MWLERQMYCYATCFQEGVLSCLWWWLDTLTANLGDTRLYHSQSQYPFTASHDTLIASNYTSRIRTSDVSDNGKRNPTIEIGN